MLRVNDSSFQVDLKGRFLVVSAMVILFFAAVLIRIWYLQIFQGKNYQKFANQNSIELLRIPAMRGKVLDRNGVIIADSRASFDLKLTPEDVEKDAETTLQRLSKIFSWDESDLSKIRAKLNTNGRYDATVIKRDMSKDELAQILARQYSFAGIEVVNSPARSYPFGDHGSHLLGYLGEINKKELQSIKETGETLYDLGDVWGISGVEKRYDKSLRGENGNEPVVQDAHGRQVEMDISKDLLPAFQAKAPVRGKDLVLAIDSRVQEAAEEAFVGASGGAVAIDPRNGDVLALLSRPEFQPEKFARGVSSGYWGELMEDPLNPLYDRTLRGLYPPGSTFKFITATAALTEKVITEDEKVFCPGYYRVGREVKRCWKKEGHGWMNMHDAIKQSCDVYFYEMGHRLGVDRIAKYAQSFGLGEATGIGINREENGLIPTEAWKRKVYHQPWVGGETLSVAIGQGFLQITPIQMAVALASVVNGGRVFQPRIVLRAQGEDGAHVELFPITEKRRVDLDPAINAAVRHGMDAVVNEEGGTAYYTGRSKFVRIGGKTGTAQVVGKTALKQVGDHAWFIAFAPVDDPQIVVTVIVEHGGHGGTTAAPVAKKMIEAYLGSTS